MQLLKSQEESGSSRVQDLDLMEAGSRSHPARFHSL